jgi:hypothetical protein
MPLADRQWQIRDLVLGPGTAYRLMDETNPFVSTARADQGGSRAWNHGSWSGAEWASERVVPLRILTDIANGDAADWLAAHQLLAAAFRAVGHDPGQVECRFSLGGSEFLLLGRPRMVEPDLSLIATGRGFTRGAFVAQDPRIYSGAESTAATGLTQFAGGLSAPLTAPFTVGGTLSGGFASLVNAGTVATGMNMRIDGPVDTPRLVLQAPDGTSTQLQFDLQLAADQWLDVDSVARTALLNGLPGSNQFGLATWGWDQYPLPPGTSTLRFFADRFEAGALATATWRSAWW